MYVHTQGMIRASVYRFFVVVVSSYMSRSFTAREARMLRVGVGSFFDLLILVVETIEQFDTSRGFFNDGPIVS